MVRQSVPFRCQTFHELESANRGAGLSEAAFGLHHFCWLPKLKEGEMFQESTTWDLRTIEGEPSTAMKIYVLFILIACIVACVEIFKAWRKWWPFEHEPRVNSTAYINMLETSRMRLKLWSECTFLSFAILTSFQITNVCKGSLTSKDIPWWVILSSIGESATNLTMALLVVFFAFLVRWHFLNRIERLRADLGPR
jgi:hypothetical protein